MQPMLWLLRSPLIPRLLIVFILSLSCVYAKAYTGAQNDHPVTLSGNTTLRSVFKAIKQQTGFAVMYSSVATSLNQDEKVTVNFKNTPLDDVLTFVLRGKELDWKYSDDVLVIHKKESMRSEKKMETDSTVTPAMVTGRITDASGAPLPGVTVQVKGTNQGSTTDVNGNFALPKVSNGATLMISSLGYEKREIKVSGKRILTQLNLQIKQLEEGVAIAYGTTTQRLSTGNINVIRAKDIATQPVANPLLALQGRVPGLFITQNTGIANGGVTVRIQGQNSLLNGNDPLYVVDGVPVPSQITTLLGGSILGNSGGQANGTFVGIGNPLSYINPSDIESISILKDADATSIYGSRAANGAILITTKKGMAGPMQLNINLQQGIGQVARRVPMLNTTQYLQMRWQALKHDGLSPNPGADYDLTLWDTTRYTNWQDILMGDNAQYTNINVDVSGGTSNLQYILGGTYHKETAVFSGPFATRKGAAHISLTNTSANQKLRLQFTANYMSDDSKLPQVDLTQKAVLLEPNAPALYNSDGTLNWAPNSTGASTWINPLAPLQNRYRNTASNLISNLNISYRIIPGLELRASTGYTILQSDGIETNTLASLPPERRIPSRREAAYGNNNSNTWLFEPQVNYVRQLAKGTFDLLLGGTIMENNLRDKTISGRGYNDDAAMEDLMSAATVQSTSSARTTYKYNALFGRLNYNWANKYLVNLTVRRDGSSRFGPANRFHNFASLGAAWVFSEESWMKVVRPLLTFAKLRASYGTTGSDQIPDYSFLDLYGSLYAGVPYQGISGIIPYRLFNPYLQWEKTRKLQAGLDLGFFQDRLLLNLTYQRNRSSNQLLEYTLPGITGFRSILSNFPATVQNTSWEASINAEILKNNDFSWNMTANLTLPRNKLVAFPNLAESPYAYSYIVGAPLALAQLFQSSGVDPATGEYLFKDKKNAPTSNPDYLTDRVVRRTPLPDWYGGIQNIVSYKGFQLDILFQFVKQIGVNYIVDNGSGVLPGMFSAGSSNQPLTVLNSWQNKGDNATVAAYTTMPTLSYYYVGSSNYVYKNASYIRLKNLSFSWQCPAALSKIAHLQNIRIYIQAQNLLTFTRYKGLDPESQGTTALPPLRVITAGLQIGI